MNDFSFALKDQNDVNTLHITDDSLFQWKLEIQNMTGIDVFFDAITDDIDTTHYHFALEFPVDTIDFSRAAELSSSSVPYWEVYGPISGLDDTAYLFFKVLAVPGETEDNMVLSADGTLSIVLGNVLLNNATLGARNISPYLLYNNMQKVTDGLVLNSNTQQVIKLINYRGQPVLPLHAGFGDSHTILNDGTAGSVVLHLTNESDESIVFDYDAAEASNTAKLRLSFTAHDHVVDYALTSPGETGDIQIVPPYGWSVAQSTVDGVTEWILQPAVSYGLEGKQQLDFLLKNIVSDHPTGETIVFIAYENVKDEDGGYYRDGQLSTVMLKQPLVFRNGNVGIGTDDPQARLHVTHDTYIAGDLILKSPTYRWVLSIDDAGEITTERLYDVP